MESLQDAQPREGRLWWGAIAAAVVAGLVLRLADPLSTTVIPAEDPYTHMALVRDHVWNGQLEPLHEQGTLYPPGMHAVLAAVWVFSGLDLYTLFRFAPAAFGAVGVLGTALLLDRFAGRPAAVLGGFAYAIAPEIAFRTSMMAPTAVDLAVLPFLLLALLHVLHGRLAWLAVAAPLSLFLVAAHPWVFGVLGLAGALFLVLAYLVPWPRERAPAPTSRGLVASVAVVSGGAALTLNGCWGFCGPGFGIVVGGDKGPLLRALAYPALFLAGGAALALYAAPEKVEAWIPEPAQEGRPRILGTLAAAALLAVVTVPAVQQGMPPNVDLPFMLGWPLLAAAAVAFAALALLPGPATHLGAALALATYPFAIYNPFDSPFWSHRTVPYLGLGLVLLAATLVGRLAQGTSRGIRASRLPSVPSRALAAAVPILLVGGALGGVWLGTADARTDREWYRMYDECEMEALGEIQDLAEEDLSTVVIVGNWRPQLVVASGTTNNTRVWFSEDFYTGSDDHRRGVVEGQRDQGRSVLVVVEPYAADEHPSVANGSIAQDSWQDVSPGTCQPDDPRGNGIQSSHTVEAYRIDPGE